MCAGVCVCLYRQASVNVNARPLAVDADMKPVVEFMQDKGVAKADIVRVRGLRLGGGGCRVLVTSCTCISSDA